MSSCQKIISDSQTRQVEATLLHLLLLSTPEIWHFNFISCLASTHTYTLSLSLTMVGNFAQWSRVCNLLLKIMEQFASDIWHILYIDIECIFRLPSQYEFATIVRCICCCLYWLPCVRMYVCVCCNSLWLTESRLRPVRMLAKSIERREENLCSCRTLWAPIEEPSPSNRG